MNKLFVSKGRMSVVVFSCLVGFLFAGSALAEKIDFSITSVNAEPNVVKSGESFKITAKFSTGVDEEVGAYALHAYVPDVPEKCKDMGWKLRETKPARYNSYTIIPWKWFKRMSGENLSISFTLNTKSWPEGDYRLRLKMLVYKGGKGSYPEKGFFLSILSSKDEVL